MSQSIPCEVCGKIGKRKTFKNCPEGWFYWEAEVETGNETDIVCFAVCSETCRDATWKLGPGNLKEGLQNEKTRKALFD